MSGNGGLPKVAFYWCSSCGGCEESVVDIGAGLLDVAAAVDIVFWPVALDHKYEDVERLEDGEIAVSFINGAIRTSEQKDVARLLRRKSGLVVAFGACASTGGIPALANLTSRSAIFDASYISAPTVVNPTGIVPLERAEFEGRRVELPEFHRTVSRLEDVIDVDYTLPGCAPPASTVAAAIGAILEGRLPERGSVLGPDQALCRSCTRAETRPDDVAIDRIRRVTEVQIDPDLCFLAQGVICMGPATRDGCGQTCIDGNMPCTGCFGPTDSCRDQGGKMIATLGAILGGGDPDCVDGAIEGLVDPAGTFYRYGMAASLAGSARE